MPLTFTCTSNQASAKSLKTHPEGFFVPSLRPRLNDTSNQIPGTFGVVHQASRKELAQADIIV